ncbi:MAG TPA: NAD(P)/FAD-dependent oxidoreductase [Candidatus Sulfotelmatobacter sp.]|nr:NAD(P)/FAD-dependent oxidoreductase [Candidatus Sulfotelmatobacter sp.]
MTSPETVSRDAIVIGGGHNGLVCAFYLAAAGLAVTLLERRAIVGGAAVTEEFHPGFRNSTASYTVSLLNPKIIRDLDLTAHGLRIVERRLQNFLPLEDGRYLKAGPGRTKAEVAKFSPRDAERLDPFGATLDVMADALRAMVLETPPNVVAHGGWATLREALRLVTRVARPLGRLDMAARRDLVALFDQSAGALLDYWFESDPIKALFGFDAIVGNYASPYTPGSAYVQLHHAFGEVNGKKGTWGHAIGGMGAITQAMAQAAAARGADIRLASPVREVVIERGRAVGAVTEAGAQFRAPIVVANLNPKLLFQTLVDAAALPEDFRARIAQWRCGSGTFRINVALSALPSFACLPGADVAEHHTAGIIIAPSLRYMDKAYDDARANGWSARPIVELLIPSSLDDTLAPPGRHVASLFCQHVAPVLPDGASWADRRDAVARHMIQTVDDYAPGFAKSVIGMAALTPQDLEDTFGLIGGDIFHGALSLGQMFSARPVLGHADYRSPVPGLYMCGSGTHPGGGVTGAPGHNAAREILRDVRRRRRFGRWRR